ncbi:hypothetical protein HGO26_11020 [Shewanella sp. S-1]|uniref:Uncharacterized protein n=1 Tax=Shewanella oncorhynchi TaxID=2726434 RepID=A0ABX1KQ04_9GAMM|nr:hypothetical protein [Shewanella oncorhynchi]NLQ23403.1 hypothetical protein [Shewanella oncorhynchi]
MASLEFKITLKYYVQIINFYKQFIEGLRTELPEEYGLLVQPENIHEPVVLHIVGTTWEITIRPIQKDQLYGLIEFKTIEDTKVVFTLYIDRYGNFGSDVTEGGKVELFTSVRHNPDYQFYVIRPFFESFFSYHGIAIT